MLIVLFAFFFFLFSGLFFFVFLLFKSVLPLFFGGAIYVPSSEQVVKNMVELAKVRPGEIAVDLGSGDGRLVIALAKAGAEAHGFEINPLLVRLARENIRKAGFADRAFIHRRSFWGESLSKFDVVVVYGISYIMKRLEEKLRKETKPGARVVSNFFVFPTWPPSQKNGSVNLYKRTI